MTDRYALTDGDRWRGRPIGGPSRARRAITPEGNRAGALCDVFPGMMYNDPHSPAARLRLLQSAGRPPAWTTPQGCYLWRCVNEDRIAVGAPPDPARCRARPCRR
jgi:hypothetical protein